MVMAAIAAAITAASAFRIDSRTGVRRHDRGVRAAVRIDRRTLIGQCGRSVSAVRTHSGTFERDDVVTVEKAEKQRKTDSEHDVSSCGDSYVRIASTARAVARFSRERHA
jgi:hypothetical protein